MTPADRARLNAIVAKHLEHDDDLRINRVALVHDIETLIAEILGRQAIDDLHRRGFSLLGVRVGGPRR